MPNKSVHGFTLVELSIVLVILGLLVGGVLSGQSLIRAAELRATTTQLDTYRIAVNSFRDKYFALPGDMNNAARFWGAASTSAGITACISAQTAGSKLTCNGNGDGQIIATDLTITTGAAAGSERFTAWKHLANAGLVEGAYTGINGPGSQPYNAHPGENLPKTRISNGVIDIYYQGRYDALFFPESAVNNNLFNIFGVKLTPAEVWNIDTKLDDGNPVTGIVFTLRKSADSGGDCITTDVASTAIYDVQKTGVSCGSVNTKI